VESRDTGFETLIMFRMRPIAFCNVNKCTILRRISFLS